MGAWGKRLGERGRRAGGRVSCLPLGLIRSQGASQRRRACMIRDNFGGGGGHRSGAKMGRRRLGIAGRMAWRGLTFGNFWTRNIRRRPTFFYYPLIQAGAGEKAAPGGRDRGRGRCVVRLAGSDWGEGGWWKRKNRFKGLRFKELGRLFGAE